MTTKGISMEREDAKRFLDAESRYAGQAKTARPAPMGLTKRDVHDAVFSAIIKAHFVIAAIVMVVVLLINSV